MKPNQVTVLVAAVFSLMAASAYAGDLDDLPGWGAAVNPRVTVIFDNSSSMLQDPADDTLLWSTDDFDPTTPGNCRNKFCIGKKVLYNVLDNYDTTMNVGLASYYQYLLKYTPTVAGTTKCRYDVLAPPGIKGYFLTNAALTPLKGMPNTKVYKTYTFPGSLTNQWGTGSWNCASSPTLDYDYTVEEGGATGTPQYTYCYAFKDFGATPNFAPSSNTKDISTCQYLGGTKKYNEKLAATVVDDNAGAYYRIVKTGTTSAACPDVEITSGSGWTGFNGPVLGPPVNQGQTENSGCTTDLPCQMKYHSFTTVDGGKQPINAYAAETVTFTRNDRSNVSRTWTEQQAGTPCDLNQSAAPQAANAAGCNLNGEPAGSWVAGYSFDDKSNIRTPASYGFPNRCSGGGSTSGERCSADWPCHITFEGTSPRYDTHWESTYLHHDGGAQIACNAGLDNPTNTSNACNRQPAVTEGETWEQKIAVGASCTTSEQVLTSGTGYKQNPWEGAAAALSCSSTDKCTLAYQNVRTPPATYFNFWKGDTYSAPPSFKYAAPPVDRTATYTLANVTDTCPKSQAADNVAWSGAGGAVTPAKGFWVKGDFSGLVLGVSADKCDAANPCWVSFANRSGTVSKVWGVDKGASYTDGVTWTLKSGQPAVASVVLPASTLASAGANTCTGASGTLSDTGDAGKTFTTSNAGLCGAVTPCTVKFLGRTWDGETMDGETKIYKCRYEVRTWEYETTAGLTCSYTYKRYQYNSESKYCQYKRKRFDYVRSWQVPNGVNCLFSAKQYIYSYDVPSSQVECRYTRTAYQYRRNDPYWIYSFTTKGGEHIDTLTKTVSSSVNYCGTTYDDGFTVGAGKSCLPSITNVSTPISDSKCGSGNLCLLKWRSSMTVDGTLYNKGRYSNYNGSATDWGPTYCQAPDWDVGPMRKAIFVTEANPKDYSTYTSNFCVASGGSPTTQYALVSDWYDPTKSNPVLADGVSCAVGDTASGVCAPNGWTSSELTFTNREATKASGWSRTTTGNAAPLFVDFSYGNDAATYSKVRSALGKCIPPVDASWSTLADRGLCTAGSNFASSDRPFSANVKQKACTAPAASDPACNGGACVAVGGGNYCAELRDFTPLVGSLTNAKDYLATRLGNDDDWQCSDYYTVLVTDGQENTPRHFGVDDLKTAITDLRGLSASGRSKDVKTFIIGFGSGAAVPSCEDASDCTGAFAGWDCVAKRCAKPCPCPAGSSCESGHCVSALDTMARLGGTSIDPATGSVNYDPNGFALSAMNEAQLTSVLNAVFTKITAGKYARSRPAVGTDGKRIYAAYFERATSAAGNTEWPGHLDAYTIDPDSGATSKAWEFHAKLNAMDDSDREIWTFRGPDGWGGWANDMIEFKKGSIGACGSNQWYMYRLLHGLSLACDGSLMGWWWSDIDSGKLYGDWSIDFIRNAGLNQKFTDGTTRTSRLADIYHSYPVVVSGPPAEDDWGGPNKDAYAAYKLAKKDRETRVLVGSNDGLLHGIRDNTGDADCSSSETDPGCPNGEEAWAIIPTPVLSSLNLARSGHVWGVDGYTAVADVCNIDPDPDNCDLSTKWRTIAVGTLRKGGSHTSRTYEARGVFGLDITDPNNPKYLWNFGNGVHGSGINYSDWDDSKIGHTFSGPALGRVKGTGEFIALVGGGTQSAKCSGDCGNAVFGLDPFTGEIAGTASKHGHSKQARYVLPNEDKVAARIATWRPPNSGYMEMAYLGTMAMRMYRMKFASDKADKWDPAKWFDPLDGGFSADMFGNAHAPVWTISKTTDSSGMSVRTQDGTLPLAATTVRQPIYDRPRVAQVHNTTGVDVFVGTGDSADPTSMTGDVNYFFGLHDDGTAKAKVLWVVKLDPNEKVINDAAFVNGNLVFSTYKPPTTGTGCTAAGDSYLYALNPDTGEPRPAIRDPSTAATATDAYKSVVKCSNCGIIDFVAIGDNIVMQKSSGAGVDSVKVKAPANAGAVRSWRRTR